MVSTLLLGLLMGLRHAFEADHLAAVASLSARSAGIGLMIRRGGAWGLGHSATLLCIATLCLLAGVAVPTRLASWFEAGVGLMLVALGIDVFRRMRRGGLHVHAHHHGDVLHVHVHRHSGTTPHRIDPHLHSHTKSVSTRAFVVGMLHGAAGSGALVLLAVQAVSSPLAGLAYVATFGIGSVIGMMAASVAIALPIRRSTHVINRALPFYETAIGVVTIAIGAWMLYGFY